MRFREHPCRNVVHECWEDVDLEHDEIRLRDAKTGARAVPLSPMARQVLTSLPGQPDNPWVISGRGPGARERDPRHGEPRRRRLGGPGQSDALDDALPRQARRLPDGGRLPQARCAPLGVRFRSGAARRWAFEFAVQVAASVSQGGGHGHPAPVSLRFISCDHQLVPVPRRARSQALEQRPSGDIEAHGKSL